jgi:hypothetical protein
MAIPRKDTELVPYSTNWNTRLTSSPATYGATSAEASAYTALHTPYLAAVAAVQAAREAHIQSSPLAATKNAAKADLLRYARWLYKNIQANATVTDTAKIEMGIKVPDASPTPQPVPSLAPKITVKSVNGRLVSMQLGTDEHPGKLPLGVNGATILSFVGTEAPVSPAVCKYEGSTSKSTVEVLFPETVEPGTQVWLLAFYFNERKQNGPACTPVPVTINYPASIPMAA